jgi:succinate-semialdehyde dehydrogenase / glutarate-semialdehyde dehydrogenase
VDSKIIYYDQFQDELNNLEIFGPCLIVIGYDHLGDVIQYINKGDYALGAAVYGKNYILCDQVAQQIQAGQVAINEMVKSDINLPFGGFKKSGIGRESGRQGVSEFTQTKVISSNQPLTVLSLVKPE